MIKKVLISLLLVLVVNNCLAKTQDEHTQLKSDINRKALGAAGYGIASYSLFYFSAAWRATTFESLFDILEERKQLKLPMPKAYKFVVPTCVFLGVLSAGLSGSGYCAYKAWVNTLDVISKVKKL